MKPGTVMWVLIFLLVGYLALNSENETPSKGILSGIQGVFNTLEFNINAKVAEENARRASELERDPNYGTTRAREYQERWQYYHEKDTWENPGTVPKELLEAFRNTYGGTYVGGND
jgi:hypothetical protein